MDGLTDIMMGVEDAGKISHIIGWLGLATADMAQVKQEIEQSWTKRRADALGTPMTEPVTGADTPQGPTTEWEMDGFLDAMLVPAPKGGAVAPKRAQPNRDVDEFLKAARGASFGREEGRTENPTVGRTERSHLPASTLKPKKANNPGIPNPLGRSRPSVCQTLKEIRAEQKQWMEEKARENARQQKPIQHKASPKKKVRKQKER